MKAAVKALLRHVIRAGVGNRFDAMGDVLVGLKSGVFART